jgi:hypothetical protein
MEDGEKRFREERGNLRLLCLQISMRAQFPKHATAFPSLRGKRTKTEHDEFLH